MAAASSKSASRHKARELALQVLYAVDHSEGARARKASSDASADVGASDARSEPGAPAEPAEPAEPSVPERRRRLPVELPGRGPRPKAPMWAPSEPATPEQTFDAIAEHFEMAAGARAFARELALETHAREKELDALIGAHARNWRVDRMAVVDRNILRLATWELRFSDTPTAVVLDEAVNLARRFGDDPSPGFVNGILDAIAQGVRPAPA